MDYWYLYVLLGLLCGVFSATFGVGSGILLIPALVLLFSFPQKSAQGICLAVMVPMALVGAIRYKLNPDIAMDTWVIIVLAIGAMAGAIIGSSIAGAVSGSTLRRLFAVVLIGVAVRLLIAPGSQPSVPDTPLPQVDNGQQGNE